MGAESFGDSVQRLFHPDQRQEMAIGSPHVKDITLQVTDACNMRCTYCYQHNKGRHRMPFDVARRFIDLLLEPDDNTARYIDSRTCWGAALNFIGGEPLLEIGLIDAATDYFLRRMIQLDHPWQTRYRLGICSNGLEYFRPEVQRYIQRHRDHLALTITIDGNREVHDACRVDCAGAGTYDRAIAAVRDYRQRYGGMVGSKLTIAPGNLPLLARAVTDMVGEGYRDINLNCVYEDGWAPGDPASLYRQLTQISDWLEAQGLLEAVELSIFQRSAGHPLQETDVQNWCGGLGLMLSVDWDGNIYPCQRYSEASIVGRAPYTIGHVDTGILGTDAQRQRAACLGCINRRTQSSDACFRCPVASGCGWCSAYHYELFGTPDRRATYICQMHKARALANVYHWHKRGQPVALDLPEADAVAIVGSREYARLRDMAKDR